MDLRIRRARGAVESRRAAVSFSAGFFAVIAGNAQRFVDQQDIGRLAKTLLHEKRNQVAGLGRSFHAQDFAEPLLHGFLHTFAQAGVVLEHLAENCCAQENRLGRYGRTYCGRSIRFADETHFTNIITGCNIRRNDVAATDVAGNRHRSAADDMQAIGGIALGKQQLVGFVMPELRARGDRLKIISNREL